MLRYTWPIRFAASPPHSQFDGGVGVEGEKATDRNPVSALVEVASVVWSVSDEPKG